MQKLYQLVPQRGRDASQRSGNAAGGAGAEARSSIPSGTEARSAVPSSNSENRSAGPARAQAGLSVNDFISKTKNQQRQGVKPSGPELIAYARYLGIDPVADHDLLWIAVEALEAPLPSDWTEHFDSNDRVFYYNATTRVSSWTHPLEVVYRDTYKVIVNFRNSNMPPAERHEKLLELQYEVSQMEKDVHKEIGQWSEHSDEQGNRFYFNKEERQSTWTDPRPAKCQILHLRQKMLHLLQSNAGATAGFSDGKMDSSSRFGPLSASRHGESSELPATKHAKLGGDDNHRGNDARSEVPSDHQNSDSDSDEERKKKKKKKKKKKDKKEKGSDSDAVLPVKLGTPFKLNASHSEPSMGYNVGNSSNSNSNTNNNSSSSTSGVAGGSTGAGVEGSSLGGGYAGGGGGSSGTREKDGPGGAADPGSGGYLGRGSPRSSAAGSNHPAWGALSPLDENGLSTAGRARVKAGIRLEPLAPASADAAPSAPQGQGPGGTAVRSSASVPTL